MEDQANSNHAIAGVVSIDFTQSGNASAFLRDGWSHQEPSAIWAIGTDSTIALPRLEHEGSYTLTIIASAHLNEFRVAQRAVFFVNGIEVGRLVFRHAVPTEASLTIPAGLLSDDSSGSLLRIYHPDHSIPADVQGPDIRDLAIYCHSMVLAPSEANAAPVERNAGHLPSDELMKAFESLGDNCELGLVQRKFGAEPIGLLRFTAISLAGLTKGIRASFAGVGENVDVVTDLENEYMIRDETFDFRYHTFIYEGDKNVVAQEMGRRLKFLRRKFNQDLEGRRKIFVFRDGASSSQADVATLFAALNEHGSNILLWVRVAPEGCEPGTLEVVAPRFYHGYVSDLRPLHEQGATNYDEWLTICSAAYGLAVKSSYFA